MNIPQEINTKFNMILDNRNIAKSEHYNLRKWLRYYLDFCKKYHFDESKRESLPHFIKKLQEKHQSSNQQKQAAYAISLYCLLMQPVSKNSIPDFNEKIADNEKPSIKRNQFPGSVQNNNSKGQADSADSKDTVNREKAETSSKNQVSHPTTCSDSNSQPNYSDSDLNNSVNETISDFNKNLSDKDKPLIKQSKSSQPVQSNNSEKQANSTDLKKTDNSEKDKGWNAAFNDLNGLTRIIIQI